MNAATGSSGEAFLDSSTFEFAARLESSWREIRAELESLPDADFFAWPERSLYGTGWTAFGLYAYGRKADASRLCPATTALLESVPGMVTAGFSVLAGNTKIAPHRGYSSEVWRYHLGVVVPEPDLCGLRVDGEVRSWSEGCSLLFDDTYEHEAWNLGTLSRVILLVDFLRPGARLAPLPPGMLQAIEIAEGKARNSANEKR